MSKLWGGCFNAATNASLDKLNKSLPVDSRLFAEDLDGSKAYAAGLYKANILTKQEYEKIATGLEIVRFEWIEKLIQFIESDEDVHTVNERRLTELIGTVGEKLHTGRSRNDQIATDVKLWLKKAIRESLNSIGMTIEIGLNLAEKHQSAIMPGYTHLQRAQPVLFSHWILNHLTAMKEDARRFEDLRNRADVLPLGSGALAGNPLGIDRNYLATILGFSQVTENSMHTVGDRDYVVDFIYCCSLMSIHLSRLSEDLILFASKEFNFVRISDEFSTGSSLMPQKRNPDSLELVRGMSGNMLGALTGIMIALKGTPSTYNKDLQYDKKYLFDSFDQLNLGLSVVKGVLETIQVYTEKMESCLSPDMLACDWAYYLVKKGVPFRRAHHIMGKVVSLAEEQNLTLKDLRIEDLKNISDQFDSDIEHFSNYRKNIETYNSIGGTGTISVKTQVSNLRSFLKLILHK